MREECRQNGSDRDIYAPLPLYALGSQEAAKRIANGKSATRLAPPGGWMEMSLDAHAALCGHTLSGSRTSRVLSAAPS